MRKSIFLIVLLFGVFILRGQTTDYNFTEGDILEFGKSTASTYTTIDFPNRNSIIKRGAIANFNALIGKRVIINRLETNEKS